jgi:hypothetical protein
MLIELGMDGFVSFQASLYPNRLILVIASGELRQLDVEDSQEPSGVYVYQDPMRGNLPQFCLHPFSPKPDPDKEDGHTTWTWFSDTLDGFWAIDLVHYKDLTWGCGLSYHAETESLEGEPTEEEKCAIWIGLPGYEPEHHTQAQAKVRVRKHLKKHGHTLN